MIRKKPYRRGFFPVGQGHRLYFELWGNPNGMPVVFLHGGPGGGLQKKDYNYFDAKKFHVLFFEQRGSNRSIPFGSIKANTTKYLVRDIVKLMDFAGFKKSVLFGGSWGSTLALVFAIQHPKRVAGLVLRGVFLANHFARKHVYFGGLQSFFPREWNRFISLVPKKHRNNPESYFFRQMTSKNKKRAKRFSMEWARLETSVLKLVNNPKEVEKKLGEKWIGPYSLIGSYYLSRNCFLPHDFILKNAFRIRVPVSIVQGRYDMMCPPLEAFELHSVLPNSRLFFTIGGHSSHEPGTAQKLKGELLWMEKKIRKRTPIQALYS